MIFIDFWFNWIISLAKVNISGEPSLQNGLELAMKSLKMLPSHASREIIIIMGSLTTCDPNDISKTIDVSIFTSKYFITL